MANINEKVMDTFEGADFVASNNLELTLVEELVMDVMEANDIAYDDPVVDELFEAFDKLDEDALNMVQKYVNQLDELSDETLKSYKEKAGKESNELRQSLSDRRTTKGGLNSNKKREDATKETGKLNQRADGIKSASARISKRAGNDKKLSYTPSIHKTNPARSARPDALKGIYNPKNEDENLQEVGLKTLLSYNDKANKEIPNIQKSRKQIDKYKDNAKKADNRIKGSQKAFDKALEKTKAKNAVVKEDVNDELINEALVANPAFKIVKTQLDKDYDNLRDAIKVWKISKYKSMIASLKKGESCYLTTPFRQVYESLDSKDITKETLLEALDDIYNAVLVDQLNEHFEVA